ncbi:MAG: hypothetical protein ACI96M_000426 [Candidatus Azotimanducaceae bacterium]|jgi:hypothetical protein
MHPMVRHFIRQIYNLSMEFDYKRIRRIRHDMVKRVAQRSTGLILPDQPEYSFQPMSPDRLEIFGKLVMSSPDFDDGDSDAVFEVMEILADDDTGFLEPRIEYILGDYFSDVRGVSTYWVPIILTARKLEVSPVDVALVTMIQNTIQACFDYGLDADNESWNYLNYEKALEYSPDLIAALNLYFTNRALIMLGQPSTHAAFMKLLTTLPNHKLVWTPWLSTDEAEIFQKHGIIKPIDGCATKEAPSFQLIRPAAEHLRCEFLAVRKSDRIPDLPTFLSQLSLFDKYIDQAVSLF